jgi:hypothetical protein
MKTCWMLPAVVVCVVCGPAFAVAQEITGTWNMVAKPGGVNTCDGKAEGAAYRWFVTESGGGVSVMVQGETAYPKLTGKLTDGTLLLEGEGTRRLMTTAYPNAVFVLTVKDRTLSGTRYLLHLKPAKQGGMTTCLVTYTVSGTMIR